MKIPEMEPYTQWTMPTKSHKYLKINEKWREIDVTHVNQWLLLSDCAALSASTWNCEKVSLQCNIRTSTRQAATPCGVQLVKATCKPGAARILLQDRYFGMLQDDARYVTQCYTTVGNQEICLGYISSYMGYILVSLYIYMRLYEDILPDAVIVTGSTSPAVQTATLSAVGRAQRHSHRSALPASPALEAPMLQEVSLGQWRTPRHLSGFPGLKTSSNDPAEY